MDLFLDLLLQSFVCYIRRRHHHRLCPLITDTMSIEGQDSVIHLADIPNWLVLVFSDASTERFSVIMIWSKRYHTALWTRLFRWTTKLQLCLLGGLASYLSIATKNEVNHIQKRRQSPRSSLHCHSEALLVGNSLSEFLAVHQQWRQTLLVDLTDYATYKLLRSVRAKDCYHHDSKTRGTTQQTGPDLGSIWSAQGRHWLGIYLAGQTAKKLFISEEVLCGTELIPFS